MVAPRAIAIGSNTMFKEVSFGVESLSQKKQPTEDLNFNRNVGGPNVISIEVLIVFAFNKVVWSRS